ncbi:thioredoxin family protein [Chitinophaga pinensis]|uniref:Thioredoxin family protein n=1 Tax=Chitinophaga pinensis TaxID=79329 RepID=A0A5C6LNK6_9BACT|nr:thioredoxin family protein [Chitinophaga pinensis]TWV95630.1 thioredoxin family protein [Chitinophaga pinensis]
MLKFGSSGKFLITSALFLVFNSGVFAQHKQSAEAVVAGKEISFTNGTWKELTAQAAKSGKLIFVDVNTTWCGPCRLLKSTTFKDENVATYFNQHFISYSVDAEKGEGETLAEQWKVRAYPTLLLVNAEGKIVSRQIGYVNAERLLSWGKESAAQGPVAAR